MRKVRVIGLVAAVAAAAACGGQRSSPPPYALEAVGGSYDDGSGLRGTAVLATLRDAAGAGPAAGWSGTLSDGTGPRASVTYADGSSGSYAALWWPDLPFAPGGYALALASGSNAARSSLSIADAAPLVAPQVVLSADGTTLSWNGVVGAASLECRIATAGGLVRRAAGALSSCAVGDLPDGTYQASILAYSTDLAVVAAGSAQRPALPGRFDVSEGRLSFLRVGAAPVVVLAAAGGAIDIGLGERTFAVWLSILDSDGTPNSNAWAVSITGPNLPSTSSFAFTYPGSFSSLLSWSYDLPATPGRYLLTATSTAGTLTTTFSVGAPAALGIPTGVTATDGAQGSALVDWAPVPGARAYLVGVWQGATFITSQWVSSPPANFPQGSFTAGQVYDVYVAATDADVVGGTRPTQVAVAENTLLPAGFVAR
jgi:hypothetical protein